MSGLFVIVFLAAIFGVFKPYITGAKRWHFGLGAFIAFILVGVTADPAANSSGKMATPATPGAASTAAASTPSSTPAQASDASSEWVYSSEKDEMRGKESRYAELEATNVLDLDFPYGEQRGRILVRKSAKFGFDVLVGVRSGQIMCNSFSSTHVSVKFDDGSIRRYGCTDASDGTNNMVFINDGRGFLANLKKSRKAVIEAEFFQNGLQQMTFNTANLEWED